MRDFTEIRRKVEIFLLCLSDPSAFVDCGGKGGGGRNKIHLILPKDPQNSYDPLLGLH